MCHLVDLGTSRILDTQKKKKKHQFYHIPMQTACSVHRQASQVGKTVHCGSDLYLCNKHLPVVFWMCGNVATLLTSLGNTQTPLMNSFGCWITITSRWKEKGVCRAGVLCDICLVSCRIVLDEVSQTENCQFCLESGQGATALKVSFIWWVREWTASCKWIGDF